MVLLLAGCWVDAGRPDGSVRELPDASAAVYSVSDRDAPVGTVYVDGHSRAAVFDPEMLQPTLVGPPDGTPSPATPTAPAFSGWINDPNTGGLNVALYGHPAFDP